MRSAGVPAVVALALSWPSMQTSQRPLVSVGANAQISAANPTRMHGEGVIAIDPTDDRRLLVCSMFRDEEIGQGIVAYTSRDGGGRWQPTFQSASDDPAGDPACAFGPDGTAYLTMIPMKPGAQASTRLSIYRSEDAGLTWHAAGAIGYLDRESLVVDATHGRFHNRLYAHGVVSAYGTTGLSRSALQLYASPDGGRTFGRPAERVSLNRQYIFGAGNSVVLSDGRWLSVFAECKAYFEASDSDAGAGKLFAPPPEPENMFLKSVSSDDGGDSLDEPVSVSGWHMPNPYVRQSLGMPSLAADATHGPFRDRVYVVWPDSRFGGTDILFSHSGDRGRTWSPPIVVNDDRRRIPARAPANHLLPSVAVNGAGVVAVTWLDRRDASDNLGWRLRLRASIDGGETFAPSTIVAEAAARFDGSERWPSNAAVAGGGTRHSGAALLRLQIFAPLHLYIPGDYAGLAADREGTFHPYWIDNRTGWHQAWTASVRVAARAVKNGSDDLAALDDVTTLTTLHRVASAYDRASQTATVTVRLENTSARSILGPFKIRMIGLDSDVAAVEAVGASNGSSGAGAVWDVTPYVDGERLSPGARSRPLVLTFKLSDVRPLSQGHVDKFDYRLVTFFARVLGHVAN